MWKLVVVFLFSLIDREIHGLLKGGANKAGYGDCSYTVAILESIDNNLPVQICSGAILSDQFILTAAHCFFDMNLRLRKNIFQVLSGTEGIFASRPYQEFTTVAEVRVHQSFFGNTNEAPLVSDIAVLKLTRPLVYYRVGSPLVRNVELVENVHETSNVVVSGFGSASLERDKNGTKRVNYDRAGPLYFSLVNILNSTECQEHFGSKTHFRPKSHICARVKNERLDVISGVCERDIGAPLVGLNSKIIGVLSSGQRYCDDRVSPAVYTRVSPHFNFIKEAMKIIVNAPGISVFTLPIRK